LTATTYRNGKAERGQQFNNCVFGWLGFILGYP
jgi:hypothetical protein